jgi:23S rRNA (guanosine2251-2'-O)-methyltransferase
MESEMSEQAANAEQAVLEGLISIKAALDGQSRTVYALYVRQDHTDDRVIHLEARARALGIEVQRVEPEVVDSYATGKTHGGVVALVGPRRFMALGDLLHQGSPLPLIVMLDGVEDPFNFGEAVRSLYAAGADGLVVRPRNWMSAAGVVARASGGASELMPTAVAETALEAALFFKARELSVACAVKRNSLSIYETNLAIPLFLVIGGEKRGISRPLIEKADLLVQVPYQRGFAASLGTAAATAVVAFEIMRQRSLVGR